jgi:Rieske Fe-S protein
LGKMRPAVAVMRSDLTREGQRSMENGGTGQNGVPRRRFLNGFLGGSFAALAVAVIYPVLRYISPPRIAEAVTNRVLASKVSDLAETGWKIFPFGSDPGILIRTAQGQYKAFSAKCTHLSCTVQYEADVQRIWCACHNGWYDLNGKNVAGPPVPSTATRSGTTSAA